MTFAEGDRAADGLAAYFLDQGVQPGDVVALLVPSSIEYAVCYQAAMRLRAITTGINPRLGPAESREHPRAHRSRGSSIREADLAAVRADVHARPRRRSRRARARRPGRDRVDERHDRHAEGRRVRPRQSRARSPSARARWARDSTGGSSPLPFAHVAYMSRPWEEIEKVITTVDPADAVERGRRVAVDGARAGDGRPGRADAVAAGARPSRRSRRTRPLGVCASRARARRRCRPSSCARWRRGSAARS